MESDPLPNSAIESFTCEMYYRFSSFLSPLTVGLITSEHYLSELGTKNGDQERDE